MTARNVSPPHSPEAVDAIIGALMTEPQAMLWTGGLEAEAFYEPFSVAAFRAMQDLSSHGRSLDPISVYEEMLRQAPDTQKSALDALHDLQDWRITEVQFRNYVRIVIDHHRLRALGMVGAEIVELGLERRGADKQIDAAQMLLAKLATVKGRREPQHITESLNDYLQLLEDLSEGRNPAIPTGIGGLDQLLNGGMRRGEMLVIGARPKHGKTALALTLARNMARGFHVLFLSQEMPVSQLMHRHTAAAGSFDLGRILRADAKDHDMWTAVTEAAKRLGDLHLHHDDQSSLNLLDIRRKAMKVRRTHGLDVLFVDFLQLMAGAGEESRNRELDVIVNGIKALALDLGIATVVLSQMSRKADEHFARPAMTFLRDSGAIEAAADQIALLFTDHAHPLSKKQPEFQGFSELEIVAHRNGPTGLVPLRFVGQHQQFGDWMAPIPQRDAKKGGGASWE